MALDGMTEAEAEWLSLIRYQVLAAGETVKSLPPVNTLAINPMQDAIESVLQAAAQHLGADVPPKGTFVQQLDAVIARLHQPDELTGLRSALIALNAARVGFKHHGNQVRDETLRRHYDVAVTAVDTVVRQAFGVELKQVSLLLFVQDEQARGLLQQAEDANSAGHLTESLWALRLAFDLVVREYESRKSIGGWRSIFDTRPSGTSSASASAWIDGMQNPFHPIHEWLESLDVRVRLMSIGVDLQRYAYFDAVAPTAIYTLGENPPIQHLRFENVTDQHVRDSYLFVVDTAIRLAASDYSLETASTPQLIRGRYRLEAEEPSEPLTELN